MKLRIEIEMDNAAFEHDPGVELARILREYAKRVAQDGAWLTAYFRDVNGNKVGTAEVVP